jgi:hypothetical protein
MWDWIESLPSRYGTDRTEKTKSVLYRGKERLEREMYLIEQDDQMVAEDPGDDKPAGGE